MKSLHLLDVLITILFYCMLAIGIIGCGAFLFYFLGTDIGIKTSVTFSGKNRSFLYLAITATAVYYFAYVYSIYLFKNCITSFKQLHLFSNKVIRNFKWIGVIYIGGYLINLCVQSIFPLFLDELQASIKIDYNEDNLTRLFNFPLNGFIIGLFFLVLSNVFQIAKNQKEENIELKQENELTI